MISRIEKKLRQSGEREVTSQFLGETVMNELQQMDDVAYVRFASVYRDFQDIQAFQQALSNLSETPKS